MSLRTCLALLLAAFLSAHAQTPLADGLPLSLDAQGAVLFKGAKLDADEFEVRNVKGASLRYLGIDGENGKGIPAGLYLFEGGKAVVRLPLEAAGQCFDVVMSQDGKLLAADTGTSNIRTWTFFRYPEGRTYGKPVDYASMDLALAWLPGNEVLITYPDGNNRACQTEVCAPLSVGRYNPLTGQKTPVFKASDRCDYTLTGFENGVVTANELCLASREAWAQYMGDKEPARVTKKLR